MRRVPGKRRRSCEREIGGAVQIEGTDNASAAAPCDVALLTVPFSGQAALLEATEERLETGDYCDRHDRAAGGVGGRIADADAGRVAGLGRRSRTEFLPRE